MGNIISDLLAKAGPVGQMFQQATGIAQALQTGNPVGLLSQMDPRMQKVFDYIQQHGGNEETAFYALAKEKGADPTPYLEQAKSIVNGRR